MRSTGGALSGRGPPLGVTRQDLGYAQARMRSCPPRVLRVRSDGAGILGAPGRAGKIGVGRAQDRHGHGLDAEVVHLGLGRVEKYVDVTALDGIPFVVRLGDEAAAR